VLDKYIHSNLVYYKHNGDDEPYEATHIYIYMYIYIYIYIYIQYKNHKKKKVFGSQWPIAP